MPQEQSLVELVRELVRCSILYARQQIAAHLDDAVVRPLSVAKRRAAILAAGVALLTLGVGLLLVAILSWLSSAVGVPAAFLIVGAAALAAAAILFHASGRRNDVGRGEARGTGHEGAPAGAGRADQAGGEERAAQDGPP
jgi:hypothetical protein